ncbi:MAG: SDR family oxidoreductase [Nitrosomonadales bacterium]|nr:SDR family oxidoreductase [Nitrosomonadales bacterium]
MQTILLTGVTGQVGSALAPLLQEKGYRVLYLIRPNSEKDAQARLREVLPNLREGLDIAINGDVTLPNAGMNEADIQAWGQKVDRVMHGAASTSFNEAKVEITQHTNVNGTRNMLQLSEKLRVSDFHYMSTAYISGSAGIFHETDFDVGQEFTNPYEASKLDAERVVRNWRNGKFTIHRLPIVLGDSNHGRVRTFQGYYGFFMPFWRLLQTWRQEWENDPQSCLKNGVRFEGRILELPLRIDCSHTSVVNLVSSDWVAGMLTKLLGIPSTSQTYHLVHPTPPKVRTAIEISLRHLGISGVRYDDNIVELSGLLQQIQAGVDKAINKYHRHYIKHGTIFTYDNLKRTLGDHYVPPPIVDEALLAKMLDYAMSVNFGQKSR